ncbi:MAG: EamA family transporter [Rhodocyclales bacterium]|nr:EamA family transporter [Rhodocyclales bacterium]
MSMRRFYLIGFVALIAFDTLSQVSFKMAANHAAPFATDAAWLWRIVSMPWVYFAIVGYLGAFFTWMTLLRHAPIGPAFAVSHLEVIGVMIISVPLFGEHLRAMQLLGAAFVVAGVVCLAFSETRDEA